MNLLILPAALEAPSWIPLHLPAALAAVRSMPLMPQASLVVLALKHLLILHIAAATPTSHELAGQLPIDTFLQ